MERTGKFEFEKSLRPFAYYLLNFRYYEIELNWIELNWVDDISKDTKNIYGEDLEMNYKVSEKEEHILICSEGKTRDKAWEI